MFYNYPINKNKLNKVTIPVDFEINSINPRDYQYITDFTGNIQNAKGCTRTIDSIQQPDFAGNNQNTIQNDVLLRPPKSDGVFEPCRNSIRFDGHLEPSNKPFKIYHIKPTHQSDVLITPFSFAILLAPTNRIYPIGYLIIFWDMLRCHFEPWPVVKNSNKPLTFDIIQRTSLNEASGYTNNNHSLIYGIEIYAKNIKNKHREALAINDYRSNIGINKMHNFYAYILKCKCVYIKNVVYVYIKNCLYGFDKDEVQGGLGSPQEYIYIYQTKYIYMYIYDNHKQ